MAKRVVTIGFLLLVAGLVGSPIVAMHGGDRVTDEQAETSQTAVGAAPALPVDRLDSTTPAAFAVGSEDFDSTLFSIEVFEDGSARWTFQYARVLENDTEMANFETFASDFRENESDMYRAFVEQAQTLTNSGTNATGRPMAATEFDRDARVGPLENRGIVEMSFTWSAFGERAGDGILVSDVFEGGLYIRADQRLRFVAGPELAFDTVRPEPSNISGQILTESDSITYRGERTFTDQRPYVRFQPASAVRTAVETDGTPPSNGQGAVTTTVEGPSTGGGSMPLVVGALAFIGLGIVAAAWLNGYFDPDTGSESAVEASGPDAPTAPGGPPVEQPAVDEATLLSDPDRVTQLLEEHGGRMKQTDIVDATEWSKSKVSMLLSEMEDEGQITKLRVGRENIISLPGAEPDAAGSPFDESADDNGE